MKQLNLPLFAAFRELPPTQVKPRGWLLEFLRRQRSGMSGHFKELGYPFDTCLWAGKIAHIHLDDLFYPNQPQEKEFHTWWPYEQTGYLLDALARLGILLDDQKMLALVRKNIDYVIGTADKTGHLAGMASINHSEWPMAVFFRAVAAYQQAFPDPRTVNAWHRHYQAMAADRLANYSRNITNLEGILKTAEWSGDRKLVAKAEAVYRRFNKRITVNNDDAEIGLEQLGSGRRMTVHGVTGSEELKLPVLLYIYTGKRDYLDAAVTGMEKMLADHLLPTGLISSEEFLSGTGATRAYESCVITDFTWSLGYYLMATGAGRWADRIEKAIFNALPGAITKDFTAMQYLSGGNQVIIDGFAHKGTAQHGIASWRQYRPNHFPQCCPGNLQRAMPNYLLRMWLRTATGAPVAALYGPSEGRFEYDGRTIRIVEATEYPFEEKIRFELHPDAAMAFPFTFRIPTWCNHAALTLNGKPVKLALPAGEFVTLERRFAPGDVVELTLPMTAKIKPDRQRNLTVERGPLVYAYPVPAHTEKEWPKKRLSPWRITPAGPWNYAVEPDVKIRGIATRAGGYPLDSENIRVKLKISARTITHYDELESGRYTPDVPLFYHLRMEPAELELVPMGATLARISTFPPAENRRAIPVVTAHVLGAWPLEPELPLTGSGEPLTAAAFYQQNPAEVQPNRDGFYDLIHHFRRQGNLAALLQFRLYADTAGAATLAVRAADRATLRLNGRPVGELEPVGCGEFLDWNFFAVRLRKGYNFLQVRVADGPRPSQYRDSWGVAVACFRTWKSPSAISVS